MTRQQIESAVSSWQQKLNLSHWTIVVRWDYVSDADAGAQINIVDGRDLAHISFMYGITEEDPTTVNHYIAHELLHMHLNDIYCTPEKMLDGDNPMLLRFLHNEVEKVVDRLAVVVSRGYMPDSLKEDTNAN